MQYLPVARPPFFFYENHYPPPISFMPFLVVVDVVDVVVSMYAYVCGMWYVVCRVVRVGVCYAMAA